MEYLTGATTTATAASSTTAASCVVDDDDDHHPTIKTADVTTTTTTTPMNSLLLSSSSSSCYSNNVNDTSTTPQNNDLLEDHKIHTTTTTHHYIQDLINSNNAKQQQLDVNNNNNNGTTGKTTTKTTTSTIQYEPLIRRRMYPHDRHNQQEKEKQRYGLLQYAYDITSQNGEDGIIHKIFELIDQIDENDKEDKVHPLQSQHTTTPSEESHLLQHQDTKNRTTTTTTRAEMIVQPIIRRRIRWCVDVGAWDGIHLSNTRQLLLVGQQPLATPTTASTTTGTTTNTQEIMTDTTTSTTTTTTTTQWNGILIEADDHKYKQLEQLYCKNQNVHCIHATVSAHSESMYSIHSILDQIRTLTTTTTTNDNYENNAKDQTISSPTKYDIFSNAIDFICIDIDGTDYWILFDLLLQRGNIHHQPKVICIEYNPTMIQSDLIYIPPKNDEIRHGCSLMALIELCEYYNYVIICTTLYNVFFIQRTLYEQCCPLQALVPNPTYEGIMELNYQHSLYHHHNNGSTNTSLSTSLYQLYDGTLKLWGCKKLLWHRIPIDEKKIQMLPTLQQQQDQGNNSNKKSNKKNRGIFPFAPKTTTTNNKKIYHDDLFDRTQVVDVSSYCFKYETFKKTKDNNSMDNINNHHHDDNVNLEPIQFVADKENAEKKKKCSEFLVQQLVSNNGFCYVTGTGMDQKLCTDALYWTNQFLQDDHVHHHDNDHDDTPFVDEIVRKSCLSKVDRARRGYSPMNTENFASLLKIQHQQPPSLSSSSSPPPPIMKSIPNDLVRKFRIGSPQLQQYDVSSSPYATTAAASTIPNNMDGTTIHKHNDEDCGKDYKISLSSLLQPNIWPTADVWNQVASKQFRTTIETYYTSLHKVAHSILMAICDGLVAKYPPLQKSLTIFQSTCTKTEVQSTNVQDTDSTILTLLGYRPNTTRHKGKHKGRPLVAAHTDVGIITVLLFDHGDCAILQRKDSNDTDRWIDVTLPRNNQMDDDNNNNNNKKNDHNNPVFVVHVADCLSDLTQGIVPSALHRIVPKLDGTQPRNCCALFVGLDPNQIVYIDDESITYADWRKRRIQLAQNNLKKTNTQNQFV